MSLPSLFDLSAKCAVVTGAGRGIGEGIAKTFAEAGAAVVCAARRTEAAPIAKAALQVFPSE